MQKKPRIPNGFSFLTLKSQIVMNIDERLTDLEIRITHQEDMIDELNKVIYRQQVKISDLETILKELAVRIVDIESNRPSNERPPHY